MKKLHSLITTEKAVEKIQKLGFMEDNGEKAVRGYIYRHFEYGDNESLRFCKKNYRLKRLNPYQG